MNRKSNLLLSVLMPVYNGEKYVAEAVESILNQTFTDFEFIIFNDGSTDRSLEILQRYAQQDNRIRLISRENRGLVKTLNEGLSQAKASLIARMDQDDVAFPDRFDLQVRFMKQHPEVACVGGYSEIIDDAGRVLTLLKAPENDEQIQILALKGHGSITHPAAMYRKALVDELGGYREEFEAAEDLDLWLRLGEIGSLANIPNPVIKYRFLASSVSGKNFALQKQSAKNACQEAWVRRSVSCHFEGGDWRPTNDTKSQFEYFIKFGWWAFSYRKRRTALIYGLKAVNLLTFNLEGWRLLICALIKPLPTSNL
jgi:glycosyltransferase involved in cell wall biosynthesis